MAEDRVDQRLEDRIAIGLLIVHCVQSEGRLVVGAGHRLAADQRLVPPRRAVAPPALAHRAAGATEIAGDNAQLDRVAIERLAHIILGQRRDQRGAIAIAEGEHAIDARVDEARAACRIQAGRGGRIAEQQAARQLLQHR